MQDKSDKAHRSKILIEAEERIHGDKNIKKYGPASQSFRDIAVIASLLTGKELTPQDCLLVQISQKLIRNKYSPENPDHRRDSAGYLGILDDVVTEDLAPEMIELVKKLEATTGVHS